MSTREKYQLAIDLLAYMIVYAPRFPRRIKQTFNEAFEELCGYFDDLATLEKREVSLAGIAESRDAAMRAKALFDSGDDDAGCVEIQYACRYLDLAAVGQPAIEPLFQGRNPLK